MACPEEILRKILEKNGVDLGLSVGVFEGEILVGFTCIALGNINEQLVAYNNSTGLIPEYRRKGLSKQMIDFILPTLKSKGCSKIILHVLEQNEPALIAYSKMGFKSHRKELCFRLHMGNFRPKPRVDNIIVKEQDLKSLQDLSLFWEWIPTWDDMTTCALRINDPIDVLVAYIGTNLVGYIVFYPMFMQILQLWVSPSHQRQGIGSTLLQHIFAKNPQLPGVNYMGVPTNTSTVKFLEAQGFEVFVTQIEMQMDL